MALIICIVTFSKATSAQEFDILVCLFFDLRCQLLNSRMNGAKGKHTIVRQGAIRMTGDSKLQTFDPEDDIEAKIIISSWTN